jgi:hypothetical protein
LLVGRTQSAEARTVASAWGADADGTNRPRSLVTRNALPNKACAAVAPSTTMIRGATAATSALSQGKQASISTDPGMLLGKAAHVHYRDADLAVRRSYSGKRRLDHFGANAAYP